MLRLENDSSALGVIVRDDFLNSADFKESLAKMPEEVKLNAPKRSPYQEMLLEGQFPKEREYGRIYLGQYYGNPNEFGKDLVRTVTNYIKLYGQKIKRQLGKKD